MQQAALTSSGEGSEPTEGDLDTEGIFIQSGHFGAAPAHWKTPA